MKKHTILLICAIVFLIVVVVIVNIQYLVLFKDSQKGFAKIQEKKLNETQIQDVIALFNSTSNLTEIKSFCLKERGSCVYYCRNIDRNDSMCADLFHLIRLDGR